jgi:hypothetical protein
MFVLNPSGNLKAGYFSAAGRAAGVLYFVGRYTIADPFNQQAVATITVCALAF